MPAWPLWLAPNDQALISTCVFAALRAAASRILPPFEAELTAPNEPGAKEVAALAVSFSPNDPMTNWLAASTKKNIFTPEAISATAKDFEQVARLAPSEAAFRAQHPAPYALGDSHWNCTGRQLWLDAVTGQL